MCVRAALTRASERSFLILSSPFFALAFSGPASYVACYKLSCINSRAYPGIAGCRDSPRTNFLPVFVQKRDIRLSFRSDESTLHRCQSNSIPRPKRSLASQRRIIYQTLTLCNCRLNMTINHSYHSLFGTQIKISILREKCLYCI